MRQHVIQAPHSKRLGQGKGKRGFATVIFRRHFTTHIDVVSVIGRVVPHRIQRKRGIYPVGIAYIQMPGSRDIANQGRSKCAVGKLHINRRNTFIPTTIYCINIVLVSIARCTNLAIILSICIGPIAHIAIPSIRSVTQFLSHGMEFRQPQVLQIKVIGFRSIEIRRHIHLVLCRTRNKSRLIIRLALDILPSGRIEHDIIGNRIVLGRHRNCRLEKGLCVIQNRSLDFFQSKGGIIRQSSHAPGLGMTYV